MLNITLIFFLSVQISDFFDRTEELFREMQWQKKLRGNKLETLIICHSGVENVLFLVGVHFFPSCHISK